MNHTDVMLKIVEMAQVGGAMPPADAVSYIARLIDRLDMQDLEYEQNAADLLKVGATIWFLAGGQEGGWQGDSRTIA